MLFSQQIDNSDYLDFNSQNYYDHLYKFDKFKANNDLEKVKGWKWFQRKLYLEQFQIYPNGNILSENEQTDLFNKIQLKNKNTTLKESGWIPIGPDVIAKSYDTISAHGIGRVNCIEFHPLDSNISIIPSGLG